MFKYKTFLLCLTFTSIIKIQLFYGDCICTLADLCIIFLFSSLLLLFTILYGFLEVTFLFQFRFKNFWFRVLSEPLSGWVQMSVTNSQVFLPLAQNNVFELNVWLKLLKHKEFLSTKKNVRTLFVQFLTFLFLLTIFLLTINTATATPNRRTLILDAVDIAATHFMSPITSHYHYVCSFPCSFCSGTSCASNIRTDLEDKTKQPDNVGHKHTQVKSSNVTNNFYNMIGNNLCGKL